MNKKILLGILAILLGLITTVQIASATVTWNAIPAINFNEDATYTSLTLSTYATSNGTMQSYALVSNSQTTNLAINVNPATGAVTMTPAANWHGTASVKFSATDTDGTANSSAVTVTVSNVNDAPVLNLPAALPNAKVDGLYIYQVIATDADLDTPMFSADAGDWAIFSMSQSGLIQFTPAADDQGRHTITITAADSSTSTSKTVNLYVGETCDDDKLVINNVEINDVTGDEDTLLPGDTLDVGFDVDNKLSVDINNAKVKAWIEKSDGGKLGDSVELDDSLDVASKDSESASLQLTVPADAKAGTYYLFITASGSDENDTDRCDAYYASIKVERNDHDLLIENMTFNPLTAVCGGTIEVSVPISNIGTNTEDDIKLSIKNSDLGIDQSTDVFELKSKGSDADAIKKMIIKIPENAKSGDYLITAEADFNSNKDSESQTATLTIKCAGTEPGKISVTADKTSAEAIVGEKTKFTLTLENTGESSATFSVQGAASWADITIDPEEVTLDAGDSTDVYVYVTPKAASEHTLTVSVYSGGEKVNIQKFTVDVNEAQVSTTDWGHAIASGLKSTTVQIGLVVFVAALIAVSMLLFAFKQKKIVRKGK